MALPRSTVAKLFAVSCFVLSTAACEDEATAPPVPTLSAVTVSIASSALIVGQSVQATADGFDQNGDAIVIDDVIWSTTAGDKARVNADGMVTAVVPGGATILATVAGRTGHREITITASPALVINEVESNGGTPGDWVEIFNPTTAPVDAAGWVFKDNDDTHSYTLPAGTTIPAAGYLVLEESAFGFGLGAAESARLYSPFGVLIASHEWATHAAVTYGRCPNITGVFTSNTTSTKGAANDCSIPVVIKINEVESNGGTPGDWVELINIGTSAVDLGGFIFRDNNDAAGYVLPAGTTVAAGSYLVLEEAAFGFGLGSADAARIFSPSGTLIDSHTWTAHAATTYGRCPNAIGAFETTSSSTKGVINECPGQVTTAPWPGGNDAVAVDAAGVFVSNLSGLTYEGAAGGNPAALWAVVNGPGTLHRLLWNGAIWTPDATNNWGAGKALRYPDGNGNPDAEGVTFASGGSAGGMYVATERNNDASTISKNSILRFDVSAVGSTLTATNEWNITANLPAVGANLGIEAITWVPDSYLTSQGFFDETANHAYNPAEYASHGAGLFFVGVEGNGIIYAFALNHLNNSFTRVATITTTFTGVMGLEFDRELNQFWATCDDTCGTKMAILRIDTRTGLPTSGRYAVTNIFDKPASLPNVNNEGFAIAPQSECVGGRKPVYWSDDNGTGGHALRRASITCTPF